MAGGGRAVVDGNVVQRTATLSKVMCSYEEQRTTNRKRRSCNRAAFTESSIAMATDFKAYINRQYNQRPKH